jgi:hypothetical protein
MDGIVTGMVGMGFRGSWMEFYSLKFSGERLLVDNLVQIQSQWKVG